ncbi:MAG: T9SS type A sorting domain-containing protein [Salinivirgaceae bacterium]|jgi:hypothetical protein|nr:T9SS type A sorting domain-containing protein [Salinivirgaceae bacterium]
MRKIYTAITILLFSASAFAGIGTDFISGSVQEQVSTSITTYAIDGQLEDAVIDEDAATVTVKLTEGTDVSALVPTFTLAEGAVSYIEQVTQTTGEAVDFGDDASVVYNVVNGADSREWTVSIDFFSTVNETSLDVVSMYPNPVNNALTISNMEGVKEVIVSNVLGQALIAKPVSGIETTINTSDFRTGIYIVTLVSENGLTRSERIIKK